MIVNLYNKSIPVHIYTMSVRILLVGSDAGGGGVGGCGGSTGGVEAASVVVCHGGTQPTSVKGNLPCLLLIVLY